MKELVLDIAKALVDNPDAVVVEETRKNDEINFNCHNSTSE